VKTDGDTPIVADFRYFPDFISQSEFAFPAERFGKEFNPITYLETVPFHLAFAFSPSSTMRRTIISRYLSSHPFPHIPENARTLQEFILAKLTLCRRSGRVGMLIDCLGRKLSGAGGSFCGRTSC
jgi:hypothetical protein